MSKVVTFGEIMLRLAPNGRYRFFQNDQMQATFGGSEANVAVSLANFNMQVEFVSKVPDHPVGDGAVRALRGFGVDTLHVMRGGNRLGIYFLEKGASQRKSICIYDREGSSFQNSKKSDYDWEEIFRDACWFHVSGITPALGGTLAETTAEACRIAREKGLTVSCDLNYRSSLWNREQAANVMSEVCKYVDVCIANEDDARDIFGISGKVTDSSKGVIDSEEYEIIAEELQDLFGFRYVAITLRESVTADNNKWSAVLFDGKEIYHSRKYDLHIVDRVGGGDSFAAGLIYSLNNEKKPQDAVEFAVAASALKHSIEGDFNRVTVPEVEALVSGDGTGRIKR